MTSEKKQFLKDPLSYRRTGDKQIQRCQDSASQKTSHFATPSPPFPLFTNPPPLPPPPCTPHTQLCWRSNFKEVQRRQCSMYIPLCSKTVSQYEREERLREGKADCVLLCLLMSGAAVAKPTSTCVPFFAAKNVWTVQGIYLLFNYVFMYTFHKLTFFFFLHPPFFFSHNCPTTFPF